MAEKKYLDLSGLTNYDAKIKALIDSKDANTLQSAKDYSDGLADNYDVAGAAATAKSEAIAAANAYADSLADNYYSATDGASLETSLEAEISRSTSADASHDSSIAALESLVGELPEDATSSTIAEYIDEAVAVEKTRALGVEGGLDTRLTGAEADIDGLEARMTTAEGKVTTLIGTDTNKSVRTIANEELAARLIPDDADESLDTLQEIAAWIQAHPDDASAMNAAITALETLVGEIPDEATSATIADYIAEAVAAEQERAEAAEDSLDDRLTIAEAMLGDGDNSVSDMIATAKQEAITAAASDATSKATTAKTEAIAAAKEYADTELAKKADKTTVEGIGSRLTTAEGEIDALQADSHTHSNKTVLDGITAAKVSNWDEAYSKEHDHSNKTVLDGITSAKVTAWDAAEQNANDYTDEKIGEFVAITSSEVNSLFTS